MCDDGSTNQNIIEAITTNRKIPTIFLIGYDHAYSLPNSRYPLTQKNKGIAHTPNEYATNAGQNSPPI